MHLHERDIPGTCIQLPYEMIDDVERLLEPVFAGLLLSQVVAIGQNMSNEMIQNWVKRGYVPTTVEKKYHRRHVVRILLINVLKDGMQLEQCVNLLEYANAIEGMDEETLYLLFCKVALTLAYGGDFSEMHFRSALERHRAELGELSEDAYQRTVKVIGIMVLIYAASTFQQRVANLYSSLLLE
jgi:hypothetical protein